VAGYEVTLARWASGSYDAQKMEDNVSVIRHPQRELSDYLAGAYAALQQEQERLLATERKRWRRPRPCGAGDARR
jgi:hypothetical protein